MRYLKKFKIFEQSDSESAPNDLPVIADKVDDVVDNIDDRLIDKFENLIDDSDIERILRGDISIEDLAKEVEQSFSTSKNEGLITISAFLALKFYISKKVYQVIRHKYPNSFFGKLKQNFDLLTDVSGTYVAFDISDAVEGNSYDKEIVNDLLTRIFGLGISFDDIFVANGRDENGTLEKDSKVLIIRSDNMDKISEIIYDSDLSHPDLEYYSGHQLKMAFGNITNITKDPYFNYFGKKLFKSLNPSVVNRISNYTKNLLKKPEVGKLTTGNIEFDENKDLEKIKRVQKNETYKKL
jgi:hypothetical protein